MGPFLPPFLFLSNSFWLSSMMTVKFPTYLSLDMLAPCLEFSSIQSGGTTMLNTSLSRFIFRILSTSVVVVREGDALTSISQGLMF